MSSTATAIHQKMYDIATAGFGAQFATYRKTPMLQVTPADLPVLAIHILRERRRPDGQANQANPRFIHEVTYGFSGAVRADTDDQNKLYQLEDLMTQLDNMLLTNPTFTRMTEGIEGMDRVAQYTKVGETTLFEIRVEMVVAFRSYFNPVIPDWLEKVAVTTQFPDKAHADAGTPQPFQEYDLPIGTKEN